MNEKQQIQLLTGFRALAFAVLLFVIFLWWKGCNCNGNGNIYSPPDTVIKVDTKYVHITDTVYSVPKADTVIYVREKTLHDTLEIYELQRVDSARILSQYFAKRIYNDTITVKAKYKKDEAQIGGIVITDTVSQNRITGRSVKSDITIPEITRTITITAPTKKKSDWVCWLGSNRECLPAAIRHRNKF